MVRVLGNLQREKIMKIHKKLSEIQEKLKAPKNQRNTFGNYNYRSCEDILEGVKPLLGGGYVTLNDDIVAIQDRIYVKATASYHFEGESVSASAFAREPDNQKGMTSSQLTGSTSSYARKYALNGLLCIDDTKDDDTKKPPSNATKTNVKAPKVTKAVKGPKENPPAESPSDDHCQLCGEVLIPLKDGTKLFCRNWQDVSNGKHTVKAVKGPKIM